MVLGALGSSIPRLVHVASLLGFILLIAAIVGLEFYRDLDTSLAPNSNPNIVSFENAGSSLLTVFTVVTLEGWASIMDWVNIARPSWANWVFFFSLVIFGAFICTNLVLGVRARIHEQHRRMHASFSVRIPHPPPSFTCITLHTTSSFFFVGVNPLFVFLWLGVLLHASAGT